MATTLRRATVSVVDKVFPVSKSVKDPSQQQLLQPGNDYLSNLPLQMLLYFNVFFFPLWFIATAVMLEAKYSRLSILYQIILIAIISAMTIIEAIRLYLGYLGNLTEKVPELAGFWLLTLLLQLPLSLFLLLNEATLISPLERAMHIVCTCFVLAEVVIGYFAIRAMVDYQVTKFHLQQFTDMERIQDPSLAYAYQNYAYVPENRYTQ